ncbi:MAG: YraN family protein [Patescibacteria group bacterium]
MTRSRKDLGEWGEDLAVAFLRRRGFEILDRNFFTTQGEIDIVARLGGDYYFVEVKTRREAELATDLAISRTKIHKLNKTVKSYCYRKNIGDVNLLLAGIIIYADAKTKTARIRFAVIRN